MAQTVGLNELVAMLRGAAGQVKKYHETLSKLDSFGGDGDHGTTMLRAMAILEKTLDTSETRELKVLLHNVGWGIMGVDGGATGPLLGTLFMGMAGAIGSDRASLSSAGSDGASASSAASGGAPLSRAGSQEGLDAEALTAAFEAGLVALAKRTKARPGDKTLIDALVPAVQAMRAATDGGADVLGVLTQAADAAEKGAAATRDMQAKFGRARNIGAKSVGNQDPGATSVSLIFRGFVEGVRSLA
jgi:dihydroxyacetone kinase-like protein